MDNQRGRVYLVGAGPGAPDLITLRGAEAVRAADVIIYDYLASAEILGMARPGCELIYAGKIGSGERRFDQAEINHLIIRHARVGRRVVRLKGGDPFVFGRGGEEAEALAAAGVGFEIVPGVTSAIAVPAFAGIPLTHREYGSFVILVTGHQGADKDSGGAIPWEELARAANGRGTIVILMATARMRENLAALASGGLPVETPAAAVQWGTTASQKTVSATLATLANQAERAGIGAPAVVVVGECARLAATLKWAEQMPLFGRRIVITRATDNAAELARRLRALGAEAIEFPVIETAAPDSYATLDAALARLNSFNWVVFTSATGVDAFIERLRQLGLDIRAAAGASLAAIGPATAGRLAHHALNVVATPREYRAEAIVEAIGEGAIAGARFLIPRAQVAREVLPQMLREKGAAEVVVAPAYQTIVPRNSDAERIRILAAAGAIDLVTFTSSSTVTNFRAMVGIAAAGLKVAVIGPISQETARTNGFEVVASAEEYTVDGLTSAIMRYFQPGAPGQYNPLANARG
ncbi:MAG TPA: uroporphyrinogen-III C-methyltransferase [Candidatus Binataceae bacterium]|nr:uroporphyrinogen-III C-methyltransferase [Candidatus Binataceae bacterium]